MATHKSVETKYLEERRRFFLGLRNLDRRSFLKISAAALGATAGLAAPQSFLPVNVAQGAADAAGQPAFRFAYISDSHLPFPAVQALQAVELLDRRRRRGSGDPQAIQTRGGDSR
jgi:anaerobic selenocysteine-containing dehydrogenase